MVTDYKEKLQRFINILSLQAESKELFRQKAIAEKVIEIYRDNCSAPIKVEFDEVNLNYYITKGTPIDGHYYPCAVAHLDQVHYTKAWYKIFQDGDTLFAMGKTKDGAYVQVGTGSDDLTGVWCCIELLINQPFMKVAFFSDEEIGCVGSKKANMEFFKDCSFVMQADRRGTTKDFIIHTNGTSVSSKEFQNEVAPLLDKHKYKTGYGSSTDVGQLTKNKIGICTVNLSCGYFAPHSDRETSLISDSFICLDLMGDMANSLTYKRWTYTPPVYVPPPARTYDKWSNSNGWSWDNYNRGGNHNSKFENKNRKLKPFDLSKDNFILNICKITSAQDLDETLNYLKDLGYTYNNKVPLNSSKFDEKLFFATHLVVYNKSKTVFIPSDPSKTITGLKKTMTEIDLSSFYETYVIKVDNSGTKKEKGAFKTYVDQDTYTCPYCGDVYSLVKRDNYYLTCTNTQCEFTKVSVYNLNIIREQYGMKKLKFEDIQNGFEINNLIIH